MATRMEICRKDIEDARARWLNMTVSERHTILKVINAAARLSRELEGRKDDSILVVEIGALKKLAMLAMLARIGMNVMIGSDPRVAGEEVGGNDLTW